MTDEITLETADVILVVGSKPCPVGGTEDSQQGLMKVEPTIFKPQYKIKSKNCLNSLSLVDCISISPKNQMLKKLKVVVTCAAVPLTPT